ncbi:MAG: chemotaxis protein CheC [Anaerolineae bacterium]
MNLTPQQQDALTELINIAFSRTAAALSELSGHRVLLDMPQVTLCPITELVEHLDGLVVGEVATVHQIFSGPVSGDALLMLNYDGALALSDLLTGGRVPTPQLDASDREVLTEVGNILLNACLGMFGNLLKVHVAFSVPRLHLVAVNALLNSLVIGQDELRYALVVYTSFHIRDSAINGYLVIVLGVASLDRLLAEVERMAG